MNNKNAQDGPVRSAKMVQLIAVESLIGKGIVGDPYRIATSYYAPDGELKAVFDPFEGEAET